MDPQRRRGSWALAAGVAGALAVVGLLGLAFDLGPFKETELTRGELVARGDEICRKAHAAFVELQRKAPETPSEAAELTGQLVGIASDELDQIEALNGPPEFDAEIDAYLAAREEGIEAMREGKEAAERQDTEAYARSQAEVAASQRARTAIAREIGFAVCSRPLPTA